MKNGAVVVTDTAHSHEVVHLNSVLRVYCPTEIFEQKIVFSSILQVLLGGAALDKPCGLEPCPVQCM